MMGWILRFIAEKWLFVPIILAVVGLLYQASCHNRVVLTVDQ